jgi:hypothetical protein
LAAGAFELVRREWASARRAPSLHSDEPLAIAIDRAAAFVGTRPMLMDAYWLAKRAGHLLGGEFVAWANHLEYQDQTDEFRTAGMVPEAVSGFLASAERAAFRFPLLQRPAALTPIPTRAQMTIEEVDATFSVTVRGMNCFAGCEPANVDALLAEIREPGTDYVVTHQLWALLLAYENRCILSAQEFEALGTVLATEVLRGLMGDDRFTDLTAERMALLALAGLTSWIPDAVVARAIATQNPDGSWPRIHVYGEHSPVSLVPEHQAALALFALVNVWLRNEGRSASEPLAEVYSSVRSLAVPGSGAAASCAPSPS